jgi:hypothetical protein
MLLISCKNSHFSAVIAISVVVINDERTNCSIESDISGTGSLGKKGAHSVLKLNLHSKFSRLSNSKYENHDNWVSDKLNALQLPKIKSLANSQTRECLSTEFQMFQRLTLEINKSQFEVMQHAREQSYKH